MSNLVPKQQAMAIGSLPFTDAERAIDFLRHNWTGILHWPQLPGLGYHEGFVEQYLGPLEKSGLIVKGAKGKPSFAFGEEWEAKLLTFYEAYFAFLHEGVPNSIEQSLFALDAQHSQGFQAFCQSMAEGDKGQYLKGQLAGPVTMGMYLTEADGKMAYYNDQLRELIVRNVEAQSVWQAKRLQALGGIPIISIDDPGIFAYGNSNYVGLRKETITEDISSILASLKQVGALTAAHCCAGADWTILLSDKLDILFFDAYDYFTSLLPYAAEINAFLAKGGVLGWGIVPTSKAVWDESAQTLVRKLEEHMQQLASLGVGADLIASNWVVTPSCGTGILDMDTALRCYQLTQQVRDLLLGVKA